MRACVLRAFFLDEICFPRKCCHFVRVPQLARVRVLACPVFCEWLPACSSPPSLIEDMAIRFQSCIDVIRDSSCKPEDLSAFLRQLAACTGSMSSALLASVTGTPAPARAPAPGEPKPKFVLTKAVKFESLEDACAFEAKLRERLLAPMRSAASRIRSLFNRRCVCVRARDVCVHVHVSSP